MSSLLRRSIDPDFLSAHSTLLSLVLSQGLQAFLVINVHVGALEASDFVLRLELLKANGALDPLQLLLKAMLLGVGAEGLPVLALLLELHLLLLKLLLSLLVVVPFGLDWLVDIVHELDHHDEIQLVVVLHVHQTADLHSDVRVVILFKEFGRRIVHEYFLDARLVPVDDDQATFPVSPKGEVSECFNLEEHRSSLLQLF